MRSIARYLPSRYVFAMAAAALVFLMTSGALGGYDGSFAQQSTTSTPKPGATPEGGTPPESNLETSGPEGNSAKRSCSEIEEARGGFLLGRIVPCLLKTIQTSSSRMSREMIEMFRPTFFAFLTFVMVLFGVQVLQNEGQLQARAFVLLLKIGFCLTILAAIPGDEQTGEGGLIGAAYGIMAETQASVMSVMGPASGNMYCEIDKFGDDNTPLIWKQMDCLLGKLYGFTVGTPGSNGESRPNMLLASSVVGMLGGFFFGGSFGVALFLACIGVLISMFALVLRVLVTFVNSYMFIALYMILAPLLLPLMFLKVTTSMFEKWYSGIIAALLLPMVICAYVVLALQIYDRAFFAEDALINQLFNQEFMKQAQEQPRQLCDQSVVNDPSFRAMATGKSQQEIYTNNPFMTNFVNPLMSAANNQCGGVTRTMLNLQGMPDGSGKQLAAKEAFAKLFQQCAELFILTLLVSMGFKTVIGMTRSMLGSGAVVAAMDTGSPAEQKFKSSMDSARSSFKNSFTNEGGTAFLGQIGPGVGNAGRGFLRGMGMDVGPDVRPGGNPPPAASNTTPPRSAAVAGPAGGAANAPSSSGSNKGGDDDGPANSGGSGAAGGARPGAATAGPAATGNSIRNAAPAERVNEARKHIPADAARFEELDQLVERGTLPEDRREEYERLIAQIDEAAARGGG